MSKLSSTTPRVWQRMLSGRKLNLLEPTFADIEPSDIARGLARIARWNGQTIGKYSFSVAQHSIMVTDIVRKKYPDINRKWLLATLLHDASEYVTGDMISPFKNVIGDEYKNIEKSIMSAVHVRFNIPAIIPKHIEKIIKIADKESAFIEAVQIAGFSVTEAKKNIYRYSKSLELAPKIIDTPPEIVEKEFLNKLEKLNIPA